MNGAELSDGGREVQHHADWAGTMPRPDTIDPSPRGPSERLFSVPSELLSDRGFWQVCEIS